MLQLQCSHLMRTANSLEKSLMLGKIKGRRRGYQRMRRLDGITDELQQALGDSEGQTGQRAVHGVSKS